MTRMKRRNQELKRTLLLCAAVLFCTGLTSIYFGWATVAVLLLAVSFAFYQGNSHYDSLDDVLDAQWHLALFINGHRKYLEELRTDKQQGVV